MRLFNIFFKYFLNWYLFKIQIITLQLEIHLPVQNKRKIRRKRSRFGNIQPMLSEPGTKKHIIEITLMFETLSLKR